MLILFALTSTDLDIIVVLHGADLTLDLQVLQVIIIL